jgi:DNA-binding MarR family transcriptional regulator
MHTHKPETPDFGGAPAPTEMLRALRQLRHVMRPGRPIGDLKPSEFMLLFRVRRCSGEEGMKVTELSAQLRVTSPTVTQMVNALEARDFLLRAKDERDGRVVRVKLTPEGARVAQLVEDEFLAGLQALIEHLGAGRSRMLIELLDEVYRYFDSRAGTQPPDSVCPNPNKEGE